MERSQTRAPVRRRSPGLLHKVEGVVIIGAIQASAPTRREEKDGDDRVTTLG